MRKYNNPRLLNTVVSGTGMRNPVRPHVIISDAVNEFVKGDLMEANAISELVDQKVGSVESATETNLTELKQALAEETAARTGADQALDERITDLSTSIPQAISDGIAEVVAGADADYDTLKEISDYIQSDKTGAAQLNNAVSDNAAAIIAERERAIAKETQLQNDVDLKADQDTTYTKTEVDTLIDGIYVSDQLANYYTKSEIDNAGYLTEHQDISNKADKSELFSRDYNDLTNKPVIPTVPTNVSAFTNDSNYQTQQLVDDRFTALINAAPAALDTLGEIADKLSDNDDAVSAIVTSISNEVDAREAADIAITTNINELATTVSTNNTTINNRVDALETSLEDRISDVEDAMPTKVSELTNDAGYLTQHQSLDNYYTKSEVDSSQQTLNTEINSKADKSTTYTKTEVDNLVSPKANASDVYSKAESDSTFIKEHLSLDEYAKKTELIDAYSKTETNELLANKANSADLATVATTGSYDDLTNKPTIPTKISEFTNDVGYLTTHQDISGKQDVITDLATIRSGAAAGSTAYQKPSTGIPKTDLSNSVLLSLNKADTAIQSHLDISGKVDKTTTVNNHALSSNVTITKSDVGLGNVTNDAQVKRSEMGTTNGVATLDSNGLVPSSLLPSYVDDVLEYTSKSKFPSTGQAGKIYVDTTTNLAYRWSGTVYTEISPSIALGETSSTAYAGNKGKALADKLNTIEEGAQVNVNADWNATSGDALILNKPTIPAAQVQSDWNQTDTSAKDYIWNKPTKVSEFQNDAEYLSLAPDANGHAYVDLGLPSGTLWATMNVGATSETDNGLYFAWGETQGYADTSTKAFSWSDYKFNPSGDGDTFTKYNTTDGKTVLDLEDDAVAVAWGGSWYMPTATQLQELLDTNNCTSTWTTVNGVNGCLFTSVSNGNTLFIPAAGNANNGRVYNVGKYANVWSNSLHRSDVYKGFVFSFLSSGLRYVYSNNRCMGYSVRGVLNSKQLHPVAFSGDYNDLENNPTIPTKTTLGLNNVANINLSKAIKSITRSGTTFTYTCLDDTTGTFTLQDTKNTAGSTNTSSKLFLIGATSQATNPLTYSQDTAYVGTDGCLYSDSKKVLTEHLSQSMFVGTCTTAESVAAKVATVEGVSDFKLNKGVIVCIKFTHTNKFSATENDHITLNVNNTGAKSIYYNNTNANTGTDSTIYGYANRYNTYMYDGTNWVWVNAGFESITTYSAGTNELLVAGTNKTQRTWTAAILHNYISYPNVGYNVKSTSSTGGSLSLDGSYPIHVVTTTGNIYPLTLSTNPAVGHCCHVILKSDAEHTVKITYDATNRRTPDGHDFTLTIPAGGYCEVDFFRTGDYVFVRGV